MNSVLLSGEDDSSPGCQVPPKRLLSNADDSLNGDHSLMAAHESGSALCTDDLQALFELAEALFAGECSATLDVSDRLVGMMEITPPPLYFLYCTQLFSRNVGYGCAYCTATSCH